MVIVMAKSAVVKIFYSEAEKQKSLEASKKQTAKKSNASPISKAARGKPGAKLPKAKVVKSAERPIKKLSIKSPKIVQPKKDQVQNQPKKAQNGAPKGAVATSLTSRNRKANGSKPVLTINALKPSAIKPTSNTPKNQVKQTNAQPNQSEKYESAIKTARMIARNTSHPKNKDVKDLLAILEKGWMDQKKFCSVLREIVF